MTGRLTARKYLFIGCALTCRRLQCTPSSGILVCLDGFMNIALEQAEEWTEGVLQQKYGDCFIRGNNGGLLGKLCLFWRRGLPLTVFLPHPSTTRSGLRQLHQEEVAAAVSASFRTGVISSPGGHLIKNCLHTHTASAIGAHVPAAYVRVCARARVRIRVHVHVIVVDVYDEHADVLSIHAQLQP